MPYSRTDQHRRYNAIGKRNDEGNYTAYHASDETEDCDLSVDIHWVSSLRSEWVHRKVERKTKAANVTGVETTRSDERKSSFTLNSYQRMP
jgi:hypothetical protein